MKFSTGVCATVAALLAVSSADEGICQRGWYRYVGSSTATGEYDGAVDFKTCTGRKYSDGTEYGKWIACTDETNMNGTLVTNVYERYYDSFKCNDGTLLNETLVGIVGDTSDATWVSNQEAARPSGFMLFDEDETYCYGAGTVQCTIETNTIYELDASTTPARFTCSGTEWYREKSQMPTRRCYYGHTFNCTDDDAFDMTLYETATCTGSSTTYSITSGCQYRTTRFWNGTVAVDTTYQDELRVLKCHACAPFATVVAVFMALFAAIAQY